MSSMCILTVSPAAPYRWPLPFILSRALSLVALLLAITAEPTGAAIPLGPVGGTGEPVEGTGFLEVLSLDPGAPGYQAGLRAGDMVYGAFGDPFENTRSSYHGYTGAVQDFGLSIERAEAGDGSLPLLVLRPAIGAVDVTVSLPPVGGFGPAYPLGSPKFDALYDEACDRIHGRLMGNGDQGYNGGWFGLILLSHPNWNDIGGARPYRNSINALRAWCVGYLGGIVLSPVEEGEPGFVNPGLENWTIASATMFLAEYVRKTGETGYLSTLQRATDALANRIQNYQQPGGPLKAGLMGHGGVVGDYPHIGWSGINIINAHVMAALALSKGAGATVNDTKFMASWEWVKGTMGSGGADDGNIGYAWRQGGGDSAGRTSGVLFGMENYGATGAAYANDLARMKSYLVRAHARMQHAHAYTLGGVALYQFALPYLEDRDQRHIMENWRFYYNLARQPDGSVAYVGGRENNGGDGYLNLSNVGWINSAIAAAIGSGRLAGFPAPNPDRIHAHLKSPWSRWPTPEARTLHLTQDTVTLEVDITDAQGTILPAADYAPGWSQLSGPSPAEFGSPGSATTSVTFPESGVYRLQLRVVRGGYTLTETYDVDAGFAPPLPGYLLGTVEYDVFLGLPGNEVSTLTGSPNYPDQPDVSGTLSALDHAYGANEYGERIHGYIIPPVSGGYRFYLATDDEGELWLNSSGAEPAGADRIAWTPEYTDPHQWNKFSSQSSAQYSLTEGTPYYFEALVKEGGGGDHISVAWTGPGMLTPEVIGGHHLATALPANPAPVIVRDPDDVTAGLGSDVTMALDVEGVGPFVYQWQLNGTAYWPAGTTASLDLENLGAGHAGSYRCVVVNPYGVATSSVAELSITGVGDLVQGGLWRDVYVDIPGSSVPDLTSSGSFPRLADSSGPITTAEAPSDYAESYGQRWTGWLKPVTSGAYRFYLTSDDSSELWLSTDASIGNASRIATVRGWTDEKDWPGGGKSSYRSLVAGERYYIEVLHKEGGGGDHLALNWQRSGQPTPVSGAPAMPGSLFEYVTGGVFDDQMPPSITLLTPTTPHANIASGVGLVLEASITDDGQPDPPGVTTTRWSQVSGPGVTTFGTPFSTYTTAEFSAPGAYRLRLQADDGLQSSAKELTVQVGDFWSPIVPAWSGLPVGSLSGAATHGQEGGTFTLVADGLNSLYRGRTADDFYFLHTAVTGDCQIVARVVDNTGSGLPRRARAGLVIRGDTSAGAPSVYVGLDGQGYGDMCYRTSSNARSLSVTPVGGLGFSTWVKLVRRGDMFSAYQGPDGIHWTPFGASPSIPMGQAVYAGLAAASGDAALTTAVLDEVRVEVDAGANIGPEVSAGEDRAIPPNTTATLNGEITDDGLPSSPGNVTLQWSRVSGPGAVTFGSPTLTSTTIFAETTGHYLIRLTADDGGVTTFSQMALIVDERPGLALVLDDGQAAEWGGDEARFTVQRSGGNLHTVQAQLAYAGDAIHGADVLSLPTTLTLGPGLSSSSLVVRAVADTESEGPESFVINLLPDPSYTLTGAETGAVVILDTPIDAWRFAWFGPQANSASAADLADPDDDGYLNVWEYATGSTPTTFETGLDPQLRLESDEVVYVYQRATDARDITWTILGAEALGASWNPAVPVGIQTNALGPATLEIQCRFPLGEESQRYLHLGIAR